MAPPVQIAGSYQLSIGTADAAKEDVVLDALAAMCNRNTYKGKPNITLAMLDIPNGV
jgi:hypothetical protein